jgi:hypothetical protein
MRLTGNGYFAATGWDGSWVSAHRPSDATLIIGPIAGETVVKMATADGAK